MSDRQIQIQSFCLTGFLFWLNSRLGQVLQNQTFVMSGAIIADWLPFQQHTALKELVGNHMLNFDFSWSVNWLLHNRHCSVIADATVLISFATCWQTTSLFQTITQICCAVHCVCLTFFVSRREHPACKKLRDDVHGCLSGARCKWFVYDPGDATATLSSLGSWKSRLV